MKTQVLSVLRPPVFDDEDRTRAASVLHVILLTLFVVFAALVPFTDHPRTVFVTAAMSALFLALWAIMRRGYVQRASWGLMGILITGITLIIYFNGSIRIPAASGFVACIVVAGLTLRKRATVGATLLICTILYVLYRAEGAGFLPPVYYQTTGFLQWATYAGIMCITAVLLILAQSSILSALKSARYHARAFSEHNQELRGEIDERQRVEKALRESEERYRTLISTSPDGIAQTDLEGKIIFVSPQLLELFGLLDAGKMLHTEICAWIAPEDRERAHENIRDTLNNHRRPYSHYTCTRADGSRLTIEINAAPWRNIMGEISGAIFIVRDITERTRAEQALRESEERYRTLFELESDAIILLDVETLEIWDANPAALQLYGYQRPELLSMCITDLLNDPEQSKWDINNGNDITHIPIRYHRNRAGKVFPVEITGRYFNWQGKQLLLLAIRNITARIAADEALRASEQKFALAFQTNPSLMAISRIEDGTYFEVNQTFLKKLGFTRKEVIDHSSMDLQVWANPADRSKVVRQLEENGRARDIEVNVRASSGEILTLLFSAEYLAIGHEKLLLTIGHDITERKQVEQALAELHQKVEHHAQELEERVAERTAQLLTSNQELESFSYSVAHDLRTPLRAIDGFSRVLLEDHAAQLDEQGHFYLRRIMAANQRMGQLIDDLLDLSRLTRSELKREQIDLSQMARAILEDFCQREPQRNVEIVIADGLSAFGDQRLMHVVLENLLNNAWKFTAKIPKASIEFGAQAGKRNTYFVRDNGAGFDMTYSGKLFGAFQRLHTEGEFPGTGIGLATVKRIIQRHGGDVWAMAEVNQGATFYFTLP
ncbi:MAG: PAS domain-containing sensor histidine kinase [Chloroflexota bacterium]